MDERELNERERELTARELRISALEKLSERGLPGAFVSLLNLEDAEKCMASLDAAESVFRAEVKKQVEERLGRGRVSLPAAGVSDEDQMSDREYYLRHMK